jgi:uncharacterized membrane protein
MKVLRAALLLGYPLVVYVALQHVSARALSLGLLAVVGARSVTGARGRAAAQLRAFAWPALAVVAVLAAAAIWNDPLALLLAPALTSFALLLSFGASLRGESVVESLARAQLGSLGDDERRYCRRVTAIWCGFFAVNGAIALALALGGTRHAWTLYTGLFAYLAMGALFAAEYAVRQWRFRRYLGAPSDFLFRRLFPPRAE